MADWQYRPKVAVDQGYHVNLPAVTATQKTATGFIKDQDDQYFHLWIHEIQSSFEVSGSTAQSARSRSWYPRFMTQPRLIVKGQFANQAEAARFSEFVRTTQDKSLRFKRAAQDANTVTLGVYGREGIDTHGGAKEDGKQYSRTPIHVKGHIKAIERRSERWVNAPEYQFEFIVAYSYKGLYTIGQSPIYKLPKWMDIVLKKGTFAPDPDYLPVPPPPPLAPGGPIGGERRN